MFKKIYIEITNICNLKCKFCPDTNRSHKQMSISEFSNVIDKIKNYTDLVSLHVKGEPLLHNDFQQILNILEKNNIKCNITTNGTLLKKKLEIINNSRAIRQINISLHSLTQNRLDYNSYLDDILEAADGINNIIISLRLWNLKTIRENDKNEYIIHKLSTYYGIPNLKEILKDNSYLKIKENLYINQDTEFVWPDITRSPIINNGRCLALKDQIAILADGTVVPCCLDNNGDIPLGNIFSESLEDILNKPLTREIKSNFENSIITCDLCKTCGFLKRLEEKRK